MDRNFRRRIRDAERQIGEEKKRREQEREQTQAYWRRQARLHAVAVAAIVLRGEPKVDEPLRFAWVRATERYGIQFANLRSVDHWTLVAHQLVPKIIKPGTRESRTFAKIFKDAPSWLLAFTAMRYDAFLLKFKLPNLQHSIAWGRDGREEAMRWPRPGTITAGEPDDDYNFREELKGLDDEPSPFACLSTDDLIFLMQVRDKAEYDWSLTEQRRHEAILKRISKDAEELD